MAYSVCIIDDKIPASSVPEFDDAGLLNSSNLRYLLNHANWGIETALQSLIERLLDEKDRNHEPIWKVSAFTHPDLYISFVKDSLYRPDIVIFDWDYTVPVNQEVIVEKILFEEFCGFFIFSGADKEAEIKTILGQTKFQLYQQRVDYLDKGNTAQGNSRLLIAKMRQLKRQNFSFKFAKELRLASLKTTDTILSELGQATMSEISNYVKIGKHSKRELVDLIAEKFRNGLSNISFSSMASISKSAAATSGTLTQQEKDLLKKIWSYRLYYSSDPRDDMVRRGDIVQYRNLFFLATSADCDLNRFWKKNMGVVNIIPLHELHNSNIALKEMLLLCSNSAALNGKINSMTNKIGDLSEGPFVLPFIQVNGTLKDFIAIPKQITPISIPFPKKFSSKSPKEKGNIPLQYSLWRGHKRICTLSEPFLTPVIDHIVKTLGGYGTPDYGEKVEKIFEEIINNFKR